MAPKILFVLSSHKEFPNGNPTGWYLPEFVHPYVALKDKAEIVIASPNGGRAPLDPSSVEMSKSTGDKISIEYKDNRSGLWENTIKLADVLPKVDEFAAIFYVGGHGPMYDLHYDPTSLALIQAFSEAKKPVSAVCHGPTVFIRATTSSGEPLLSSATVTAFSDVEEIAVGLMDIMPYSLEQELQRVSGGKYVKADEPWKGNVVVSKTPTGATLITGQNPASAEEVGKKIAEALGI